MFEHFKQELLSFEKFILRLVRFYFIATALLVLSLIPGVIGFIWIGELDSQKAFINSISMLGTLSPPYVLQAQNGQIFTAIYGLFSQTVFLLSLGLLVAPVIHRVFHKFHIHTA